MNRRRFLVSSLTTVAALHFNLNAKPLSKGPGQERQAGIISDTAPLVQIPNAHIVQQSVVLNINLVSGNLLNFSYSTPSGNRPHDFSHQVFLWAASENEIPWNSPVLAQDPILLDHPEGDQNMEELSISTNAYILGYAVGPMREGGWSRYVDVVASAFIPACKSGDKCREIMTDCCSITPTFVGVSSIACNFVFLPGFYAKSSGSWIGLWEGENASWLVPPKWFTAIAIDTNKGTAGINGLSMAAGQKYTLGLFTSGYSPQAQSLDLKRLSCLTTFST